MLFTSIFAQNSEVVIRGKVIDANTKSIIPYVTIRIAGNPIGTTTDLDGKFNLKFINNNGTPFYLVCSSVGYQTYTTEIATMPENELVIIMKSSSIVLDEVKIYSKKKKPIDAEKLIKRSLNKLKKTCPPSQSTANYSHYIMEGAKYTKFAEAKIKITDPNGFGKGIKPGILQEMISIIQKRESLDMSENKIGLIQNLYDTECEPYSFLMRNRLKYKYYEDEHLYSIEDTILANNQITYVVNAKDIGNYSSYNRPYFTDDFDMKFHIQENVRDQYDFNITKFELNYHSETQLEHFKHTDNSTFTIELIKEGNFYKPSLIESIIIQKTYWKNYPMIDDQIISYHKVEFEDVNFNKQNLKVITEDNLKYDEGYWVDTTLPRKIIEDLSTITPLHEQFRHHYDAEKSRRMQDSIDFILCRRKISKIRGNKTIYLVLWDKDNIETIHHKIYRPREGIISNANLEIIFVGKFEDRSEWSYLKGGMLFPYYSHFNSPFSWKDILPENCGEEMPHHVIIHKNEEVECFKLPPSKEYLVSIK